jgi:hypothetical protein
MLSWAQEGKMPNRVFDDKTWAELSRQMAAAFRLTQAEAGSLASSKTARLVAAIPFVAGCDHPERTALAHLATFRIASTDACAKVFDHDASDNTSPTARLAPIADFIGGDRSIIAYGMELLAIIMTNGYAKDIKKDLASGEYNPVGAKIWDAEAMKASLASDGKGASALDPVMTKDEACKGFWSFD